MFGHKHPSPIRRWSKGQLRLILGLLFLALAIPTVFLTIKARQQIKWEALYQNRKMAEELSQRIDSGMQLWANKEAARPIAEYQYLIAPTRNNYLQRSPLAEFPYQDGPPGLIGYFQVDEQGRFQTPLLPADRAPINTSDLTPEDIQARQAHQQQLLNILSKNQLVAKPAAPDSPYEADRISEGIQSSFDKLAENNLYANTSQALGKIDELKLERSFADAEPKAGAQPAPQSEPKKKSARKQEQIASYSAEETSAAAMEIRDEELASAIPAVATSSPPTITLFNTEPPPFSLALLDSGHFILFRYVWDQNQRLVQGLLLDQAAFLQGSIKQAFSNSQLSNLSNIVIAYQGNVLNIIPAAQYNRSKLDYSTLSAQDVKGILLLQSNLTTPFSELALIYSAARLPDGPGGTVITWASVLLIILLFMVFGIIYRLGLKQIRLAQQQQNFIASVSHELKTPLTSIRMFSEMLKEGWATPEKQQEYYSFISDESERLSRLITNVLQLARMERQELKLNPKPIAASTLVDLLQSRVQSQVTNTDFMLHLNQDSLAADAMVVIDSDALMQIIMNLVDNSIKFAADADNKTIGISIRSTATELVFKVRDYGPGIPSSEAKRIFTLFYRVGNELTRSAQGTGIGLALVQQLVSEMDGQIEIYNPGQGAGFAIRFPLYRPNGNSSA